MGERGKIPEKVTRELWIRSGGRCNFCVKDLTMAYPTGTAFDNYGQQAHICAFSESGPRAVVGATGDNSYENLILLCPDCHKAIDDHPDDFPADRLKKVKRSHCEDVKKVLDSLFRGQYTLVVYSSTVYRNNERIRDDEIHVALREAEISWRDRRDVMDDRNDESTSIVDVLRRNFEKRIIRSDWDCGNAPKYCIFAFGPMYALIVLGSMFCNYRNEIKIAIKTRRKWTFAEGKGSIEFSISKPETEKRSVDAVLELNVSAKSDKTEITKHFPDIDVWSISAPNPGIDIIDDLADVNSFGEKVVRVLDEIKTQHPGGVVHVVPRVCNALAVQFGRSVMPKVHPQIKIYDVTKDGIVFKCNLFDENDDF